MEGTSEGHLVQHLENHLGQAFQNHVQAASEYLQGEKLHNIFVWPVPLQGHPHSEEVFPDVQVKPPMFQFVFLASWIAHGFLAQGSYRSNFIPLMELFTH